MYFDFLYQREHTASALSFLDDTKKGNWLSCRSQLLQSKITAYVMRLPRAAALLTHIAEGNEIGVGAAAEEEMLDSPVPFEKDPFPVVLLTHEARDLAKLILTMDKILGSLIGQSKIREGVKLQHIDRIRVGVGRVGEKGYVGDLCVNMSTSS